MLGLGIHTATSVCNFEKYELAWFGPLFISATAQIRLVAINDSGSNRHLASVFPYRFRCVYDQIRDYPLDLILITPNC